MTDEVTADAVARVLAAAGFDVAQVDDCGSTRAAGFTTVGLPIAELRVAVTWHSDNSGWSEDEIHSASASPLGDCAEALEEFGYQTRFVTEFPSGYLVVWTDGEF